MKLSEFITTATKQIISEWVDFARTCIPSASEQNLVERRDHLEGMLKAIVIDLDTPQTKREQADKSEGKDDGDVDSQSAANAHGTERAASGYTPVELVGEFRALRASVLRLWTENESGPNRVSLEEVSRFNEAVDQALAESMARYAQDVESSKDLFLGVLGHDLRNPLGAIMMSATVMIEQEGLEWPHAKAASRILRSGTRMDHMINDLLDFTRARLGAGIPVVLADTDIEALCRQAIDEITAFHPRSTVSFEASGPLRGEWDRARIGQALSNLIGNAYRRGAEQPVTVTARGDADRVELSVHDQGPVIAKGQLQEIFNPFRKLDPGREESADLRSVGLGLYIAQSIVKAHHGTIEVESSEAGTTFTVTLPRGVPPM
jgi:signal transduction histidine kinase